MCRPLTNTRSALAKESTGLVPERRGGEVVGRGDRRLLRLQAVLQAEMLGLSRRVKAW